jgi:hypothetical protein
MPLPSLALTQHSTDLFCWHAVNFVSGRECLSRVIAKETSVWREHYSRYVLRVVRYIFLAAAVLLDIGVSAIDER